MCLTLLQDSEEHSQILIKTNKRQDSDRNKHQWNDGTDGDDNKDWQWWMMMNEEWLIMKGGRFCWEDSCDDDDDDDDDDDEGSHPIA